ncbi:MAG: hypothetical protein F6K11_28885 [Leptolyngbya sp. SIO3F4]|nr:hypothetical protein [Leptolyngbya sp. SIO3F4]
MDDFNQIEVVELAGSQQFVFQSSISSIVAQGAVTVAIELCAALILWQTTRLIEACKRPAK